MEQIGVAIEKRNLYEQVVSNLENYIFLTEFENKKLPSEQELSKQFNVSKAVVREALKVLKDRGLIQSRNGDGSYVSKPQSGTIANAINRIIKMDKISNKNLHDIRLILETASVKLAVLYIEPDEIKHLESTIDQMSDLAMPFEESTQIDVDFHVSLARASRNDLLVTFVEIMMHLLRDYMFKCFSGPKYDKKCTLKEHREILKALKLKEQEYAEKAILEHIFSARNFLHEYEQGCSLSEKNG